LDALSEHFGDLVISDHIPGCFGYGLDHFLPISTPVIAFKKGYLKDSVYKNSLHTADKLKEEISLLPSESL
jgi:hypothetical protein